MHSRRKVETAETVDRERRRVKKVINDLVRDTDKREEAYQQIDECSNEAQISNVLKTLIKNC